MDRAHAYGNGPVCPRVSPWLFLALRLAAPFHSKAHLWARAAEAWHQFEANATLSAECRFGPKAWCVNLSGKRNRIKLLGRVICRGVLRLENVEGSQIIIHPEVYIGDDCLLSSTNRIEIGSHTLLAHGVEIFDNNSHPVHWLDRMHDWQARMAGDGEIKGSVPNAPVTVGEHVWVGAHTMIFKGVTIGDKSVIAAGSVVTRDIPSGVLAAGNPATVIRVLDSVE